MASTNDYTQGFKDGFAAGLEEGKKLAPVKSSDPWGLGPLVGSTGCLVCGRYDNAAMGYVCTHPKCPSRVAGVVTGQLSVAGSFGAVGSMSQVEYPKGANGPAGETGVRYGDSYGWTR